MTLHIQKVTHLDLKNDTSNTGVTYVANYQCFERLVISRNSEESEVARLYLMKSREFMTDNQQTIF